MPERAEIEAVAAELKHNDECGSGPVSESEYLADAEAIIRVLDRVRDARGDDECSRGRHEWAVSGDPATTCVRCGVPWAARSPQGEDHEAGIAVLRWNKLSGWNCDRVPADWPRETTEVARVSPSRDGAVAVEDWRTIAVRLASLLRELHPQNPYYREKQAEALAAFDALAGESNEGGNQNDERRH